MTLCLNKYGPAASEAAQGVVKTTRDGDKFSRHRAIEVGATELCCPLERTILVQDNSLVDQGCPRQEVRKTGVGIAIFGKIHHD